MDRASDFGEALSNFLIEKELQGCTPKTLKHYRHVLTSFVADLGDPVRPYLLTYLHTLGQRISQVSVASHARSIKAFLRWCHVEGYCEDVRFPRIRCPETAPKGPAVNEVRSLLRSRPNNFEGRRDTAIISLVYDTGMRLRELHSLTIDDVNLREGFCLVYGKGSKERYVPFGRKAGRAVWRYLKDRNRTAGNEGPLWVSRDGRDLSFGGITNIFRRFGINAHKFRHAFALAYIDNGGDAITLQRILGHTTLEMTARYVRYSTGTIKRQHARHSPADRI